MQDDTVNPNLLWEMVKMKVREESLKYGTSKKKKLTKKEEEIEQAIATLQICLLNLKVVKLKDKNCGPNMKQRNMNWRQ